MSDGGASGGEDGDRVLEALNAALAPPPAEPSEAEREALRGAVRRRFGPPRSARKRGFFRRPTTLLAAAAVLFTTGTAVAVGAGSGLSVKFRTLAHAIGLPVESAALVRARSTVSKLREALAARDAAAIRGAAAELREAAAALAPRERRLIEADESTLLAEAERALSELSTEGKKGARRGVGPSGSRSDPQEPEDLDVDPEVVFEGDPRQGALDDDDDDNDEHGPEGGDTGGDGDGEARRRRMRGIDLKDFESKESHGDRSPRKDNEDEDPRGEDEDEDQKGDEEPDGDK